MKCSKETDKILLTMYETGSVNKNQLSPAILCELFQRGYIVNSSDYHDINVYLTDAGKAYVEEIKLNDKRYEEEKRRSWIQFWIPLILTNIISASALVISILAYIKQ